jgi:type VI secretion system protein ImpJ
MFLRPHHFQAAQRYEASQRDRGGKWDLHYNWGLRSLVLNTPALANYRFEVQSLEARLRDGTLVAFGPRDDAPPPPLDLRGPLKDSASLTVLLAVPVLDMTRPNVGGGDNGVGRYLLDTQPVEDENTGQEPQPLELRRLNVRLLASPPAEHPGYEVLPIARVKKSGAADATPQIDPGYIPPVLACDAWEILQVNIVRYFYDRIGTWVRDLAEQARSRGIGPESQAPEHTRILAQLRALNEAYAVLNILAFAGGIHPLEAYTELCRLAGQLAIFQEERGVRDLPRYDHDDLARCFYELRNYIDWLFEPFPKQVWLKRDFEGVGGLRMQVALEPVWLHKTWQMFVGVETTLPANECVRLLRETDMKIGSPRRVEKLFVDGLPGLQFTPQTAPDLLPKAATLVYFQVDRDAEKAEWQFVQDDLALAIRLNVRRIVGSIQGQKALTIDHGGQTTTLRFALYLLPPSGQPPAQRR